MAHHNSKLPGWLGDRSVAFWTVIAGVVAVISLLITVVTLVHGQIPASSAGQPSDSSPATTAPTEDPSSSSTAPNKPNPSAGSPPARTVSVSQELLTRALLPANALGSATAGHYTDKDISQAIEICGGASPGDVLFTVGHYFYDTPNSVIFTEGITDYGGADEASQLVRDDISAVGRSGCSHSGEGVTDQYEEAISVPLPRGCTSGPSLAATASIGGYFNGYHVEVACGTFTITVEYLTHGHDSGDQEVANGYLNNLVGRLMKALKSAG